MTRPDKLTFSLQGLGCIDCVAAIENAVMPLAGVSYVGVSLFAKTMTVRPAPSFDVTAMVSRVQALGYRIDDIDSETSVVVRCRCRSSC